MHELHLESFTIPSGILSADAESRHEKAFGLNRNAEAGAAH